MPARCSKLMLLLIHSFDVDLSRDQWKLFLPFQESIECVVSFRYRVLSGTARKRLTALRKSPGAF